jgi:hypothetical protein
VRRYKQADKKAPRFRLSKYRYTPLNRELFEKFKEAHSNIKMDYLTFKDVILNINQEYVNFALKERDGIFLPSGLGRLYLCMFPPIKQHIEKEKIKDAGYQRFNFDSSGFVGKISWKHADARYKVDNIRFYAFVAHRDFKKRASIGFRDNPEKYVVEVSMLRVYEKYKLKEIERVKINGEVSNQPSENTEQGCQY